MVVLVDNPIWASQNTLPKSTTAGMLFGPQLRQVPVKVPRTGVMMDLHWLVILLLFSFACGYAFHAEKSKR